MSSSKPMKTERTHEENQERAYIAASRRSDRSLEARIESARRASEIHKRRTGRSLRVTEQDVINEEMYEEEDDDLPMQYRRLTAHLQTQNADFNRRFQSYLLNHVAMRQAVGNAAVDGMQMNNQFQPNVQFINPGYMQMSQQQPAYPGSMMPPKMYNRTPSNYRQQPYPMPQNNMQPTQPTQPSYHTHGRPLSVATPQNAPQFQQQHSQSGQTSSVDAKPVDDPRMSLPVHTALPVTPLSQQGKVHSPTHTSPAMSRTGSVTNAATPHAQIKPNNSPQQVSTPLENTQQQPRPQLPQQEVLTSPFGAGFDQQMNAGMTPFTMTLPMGSQQMLADSSMLAPSMSMMFSQQSYSYNPNGKPRNNPPSGFDGLNQTWMALPLDTGFGGFESNGFMASPQSAYTDPPYTPQFGYGNMGFDSGYGSDMFKGGFDGSGDVTPQDLEFNSMFTFPEASQEDVLA
ncbi:hypothetical protein B0A55_12156 [Friedmanniomyces simplex]|uniref:Uncharacterized protein n=1 Tax=Friedmanniomyces simplex TaxID=329884 RepID=A0A4U0WJD8_9PEZI|nr:hypothetical protein B0A55_12156 [Friedmanniomyces simplex]